MPPGCEFGTIVYEQTLLLTDKCSIRSEDRAHLEQMSALERAMLHGKP